MAPELPEGQEWTNPKFTLVYETDLTIENPQNRLQSPSLNPLCSKTWDKQDGALAVHSAQAATSWRCHCTAFHARSASAF